MLKHKAVPEDDRKSMFSAAFQLPKILIKNSKCKEDEGGLGWVIQMTEEKTSK